MLILLFDVDIEAGSCDRMNRETIENVRACTPRRHRARVRARTHARRERGIVVLIQAE